MSLKKVRLYKNARPTAGYLQEAHHKNERIIHISDSSYVNIR